MLRFKEYCIIENIEEATPAGLADKAAKSGISISILRKVYNRGMAAWNTSHRPGTTPQQWAMARVNSYITKGKGTYYGADKDLREKENDESESWEDGYDRRVVRTTKPEHKEKGFNWRIKGKERSEISIKLYKEKPSQAEFNKQMKRVAGHEFGEEYEDDIYAEGLAKSTLAKRAAHFRKADKLDDDDPDAYKPALFLSQ